MIGTTNKSAITWANGFNRYMVFVTRQGVVKIVDIDDPQENRNFYTLLINKRVHKLGIRLWK